MTLKQQVYDAVNDYCLNPFNRNLFSGVTNAQVAIMLAKPEPSVRRATRTLEREGRIIAAYGGYSNIPIEWTLPNDRED